MSVDVGPRPQTVAKRIRPRAAADRAPATPEPPRLPGRRNPTWIALGVVALCLGGLLSYAIYSSVATDTSVVAMTRTVYRGEVVERADLTKVIVQGDSLPRAVLSRDLDSLVGQRAGFDLLAGSVVLTDSLSSAMVPKAGRSVVGLRLTSGRAPAGLLLPSSPVRLVALPPSATESGTAADKLAGKTYLARIIDSVPGADGTSNLVDVEVAAEQAPTIALLAAQDRIAVVRDPEG